MPEAGDGPGLLRTEPKLARVNPELEIEKKVTTSGLVPTFENWEGFKFTKLQKKPRKSVWPSGRELDHARMEDLFAFKTAIKLADEFEKNPDMNRTFDHTLPEGRTVKRILFSTDSDEAHVIGYPDTIMTGTLFPAVPGSEVEGVVSAEARRVVEDKFPLSTILTGQALDGYEKVVTARWSNPERDEAGNVAYTVARLSVYRRGQGVVTYTCEMASGRKKITVSAGKFDFEEGNPSKDTTSEDIKMVSFGFDGDISFEKSPSANQLI